MDYLAKTIFVDIDGVILKHHGKGLPGQMLIEPVLLPGVVEKFREWDEKGYFVVITTGRNESSREITIKQLESFGLSWDILIMGLPRGERIVINDSKTDEDRTATGIVVIRNNGLGTVKT